MPNKLSYMNAGLGAANSNRANFQKWLIRSSGGLLSPDTRMWRLATTAWSAKVWSRATCRCVKS